MKSTESPVLFTYLQNFKNWWKGFNEQDQSRLPTAIEKRQMLRYPVISSIAQLTMQPLLAPKVQIEGEEKQKAYIEHWLRKYYRRIMAQMLKKAIGWGFSAGERVLTTEQIKEGTFLFHKSIIAPEPYAINLMFKEREPGIAGFEYQTYQVLRQDEQGNDVLPGMVYYNFRGEEISMPKGDSLLNDMFWAWQLVMKEWTSWVVYKRMKVPVWVLYFVPDLTKDGTTQIDTNRVDAEVQLENLKNAGGIALPKVLDSNGDYQKAWELSSADMQDREPGYHESIKILNSMMYLAALMPERLMEQFKDTGSQSMVQVQKDFYTENVLAPRVSELGEYVDEWFLAPMIRANFSKPDYKITFTPIDSMTELYVTIVTEMLKGGHSEALSLVNIEALMQKSGIPVLPEIERKKKIQIPAPFPPGKDQDKLNPEQEDEEPELDADGKFETRHDQRLRLRKKFEPWVRAMDKEIQALKVDMYDRLEKDLRVEQGRITLMVKKLYERNVSPDPDDIAAAIQIPDRIYKGSWPYVLRAWRAGMLPVIDEAKKRKPTPYMSSPSRPTENELWALDLDFEGYASGKNFIAGEGEMLERRLFAAVRYSATDAASAFQVVTETFNKYIEQLLPNRLIGLLHPACVAGTKDAIRYLLERDAQGLAK